MSRSSSPCPTAVRFFVRSARSGHEGLAGRCKAGAALHFSGAAPLTVSFSTARPSLPAAGRKVSTVDDTPGRDGSPHPLKPIPTLAVLTIGGARAAFHRLAPRYVGATRGSRQHLLAKTKRLLAKIEGLLAKTKRKLGS